MFQGSLPSSAINIIGDIVKTWAVSDIYVGCSGNFTIQRALAAKTGFNLHGNDVTVYSCLLGRYFAGLPLNARFKESYGGPMAFVRGYMTDDTGIAAIVLLLSAIGVYLESKPNPYYEKMLNAYISQWGRLFEETYGKLSKIEPFLKSFYSGDVIEWLRIIPEGQGFICYPPFYLGGYEKMFKAIDSIIEWDEPAYDMLGKDKILEMFRELVKRDYFMFGTDDELPEFKGYLRGESFTSLHGVPLHIYSAAEKSRIIVPIQNAKSPLVQRLGEDDDMGGDIKLVPLLNEWFNALRAQYLNPKISTAGASASFGVVIDGKLAGAFAFSASPTLANWGAHIETPSIYLLSDFPVAPTKYKRLSKLIVAAALSKESKLLAERLTNKRVKSLVTTAFTNNPASMKYRGLLKLLTKKEIKETQEDKPFKYQLNYGAAMGQWTLKEGLEMWKKKHSQSVGMVEA